MTDADYIIVGSGINALVAASMLGRKGHKVLVLERNPRIGGCILTDEITEPGFVHDVMATTFTLFVTSPAFKQLGPDLEKRGLEFAQSDKPTAVLLPDERHAIARKDRDKNILVAFQRLIEAQGGSICTGADVASIIAEGKIASGVRLANDDELTASRGVICSTTPQQLYTRLLEPGSLPASVREGVRTFRHGKGNMQIHNALSAPPKWHTPEIGGVALTHLTPGLDGVSRASNEAERGMLPRGKIDP